MRGFMVLMMALLFVIGSPVGQARGASICPYDGGIGTWSGRSEMVDWKKYDVYRCIAGHEYLQVAQSPQDRQKRYVVGNKMCPFDGLRGVWHNTENIDGKKYDVYRCAGGHEYLDISWHNSLYDHDGDCPFDNSRGWRTSDNEFVSGGRYDVYRCQKGHEYLYIPQAQTQASLPSQQPVPYYQQAPSYQPAPSYEATSTPDYQAGLALGSVLGELLKGNTRSERSDHDDDVNKEYDLSKVKTVFIVAFPDPNYSHSTFSEYVCEAAGQRCKTVLEDELKERCPEIVVDGLVVQQTFQEEYDKYAAEGGVMSEADFKTALVCRYADLLISIKTERIGCDSRRAWCDVVMVALDAKTGENVFTRQEERVHTHKSSKRYTEQDVLYKTVHDYAQKLAKLIKRSSK